MPPRTGYRRVELGGDVSAFGVVLTVAVLVGIAVFILVFERRRAKEIERDLRHELRRRSDDGDGPGSA